MKPGLPGVADPPPAAPSPNLSHQPHFDWSQAPVRRTPPRLPLAPGRSVATFFSPITLCLIVIQGVRFSRKDIHSRRRATRAPLFVFDTGSRQSLAIVLWRRHRQIYFTYNILTGRKSLFPFHIGSRQALPVVPRSAIAQIYFTDRTLTGLAARWPPELFAQFREWSSGSSRGLPKGPVVAEVQAVPELRPRTPEKHRRPGYQHHCCETMRIAERHPWLGQVSRTAADPVCPTKAHLEFPAPAEPTT